MGYPGLLTCERRSYMEQPLTHSHPYAQLVVPVAGALLVTADAASFHNDRPSVVFIPPAVRHCFSAQTANQFLVFDIPPTYLPNTGAVPGCYPLDERWRAIRALLIEEVGEAATSNQRVVDLFRYITGLFPQNTDPVSLQYIRANYRQRITIRQLAALEHYNPSYYCEWFQKQYALTPMAYIRKLRLDAAQELLRETDYSIIQIAQQVGYQHHSTLTRLFLESTGIHPSAYRIQNRIAAKQDPNLR